MERLRYVARAGAVPVEPLVREAAKALLMVAHDPMALLTACRQLLARRPDCGPLMWLASKMVIASDARQAAFQALRELSQDRTGAVLDRVPAGASVLSVGYNEAISDLFRDRPDLAKVPRAEPAGHAVAVTDVVLVSSDCVGPLEALVDQEAIAVAEAARNLGVEVWLVTGVGRIVPARVWRGVRARVSGDDGSARHRTTILDVSRLVTRIATPRGLRDPAIATCQPDFSYVPSLLDRSP